MQSEGSSTAAGGLGFLLYAVDDHDDDLPGCATPGDCAGNAAGSACVDAHCGCASASDCPAADGVSPGRACLLAGIFVCVPGCNEPNVTTCNGGCCSAAINGTCQPGTSANASCGAGGSTCVDCQGSICVQGACTSAGSR